MQSNKSTLSFVKGISSTPTHTDDIHLFNDQGDEKFKYVNSLGDVSVLATEDQIPGFGPSYALESQLIAVSGNLQDEIDLKLDTSVFAALSGQGTGDVTLSQLNALSGSYVSKTGDTMTGLLTVSGGIDVYAPVGSDEIINFYNKDGLNVGHVYTSGSGNGSFAITRYDGSIGLGVDSEGESVNISKYLGHVGDSDTRLAFASNNIKLETGGVTNIDLTPTDIALNGDVTVTGDLTVDGTTVTVNSQEVLIEDNIITLNSNMSGSPPSFLESGIKVDRGDEDPYYFTFDESNLTFSIGVSGISGDQRQAVATREAGIVDNNLVYWDANDFIFRDSGVATPISGGFVKTIGDTMTGLLVLNGGLDRNAPILEVHKTATGGGSFDNVLATFESVYDGNPTMFKIYKSNYNTVLSHEIAGEMILMVQGSQMFRLSSNAISVSRYTDIDFNIYGNSAQIDYKHDWFNNTHTFRGEVTLNDTLTVTPLASMSGNLLTVDSSGTLIDSGVATPISGGFVKTIGDTMTGPLNINDDGSGNRFPLTLKSNGYGFDFLVKAQFAYMQANCSGMGIYNGPRNVISDNQTTGVKVGGDTEGAYNGQTIKFIGDATMLYDFTVDGPSTLNNSLTVVPLSGAVGNILTVDSNGTLIDSGVAVALSGQSGGLDTDALQNLTTPIATTANISGANIHGTFIGNGNSLDITTNTSVTGLQTSIDGISGVDQRQAVGSIIPDVSGAYDLGSVLSPWRDLYLTENSIYMGDNKISFENDRLLTNGVSTNLDGVKIDAGFDWTVRNAAGDDDLWRSVTYGNGLFVAVGGAGDRVMTSPDGITWTARSAAGDDDGWNSVTYGNGLFVAVGGAGDRVMTSPDGATWTARTAAGDNDLWLSVTYGNGLFVAVGSAHLARDAVMTSPDGITWTARSAAGDNDYWRSVTYGNGLFVAVGTGDSFSFIHKVMYSSDGINWTARNAAGDNDGWNSVTYGNGLFVAVGSLGDDRVMTSPDGVTWTARTAAGDDDGWYSVTYGNGLFVAVSESGTNYVMTSPDGITWTEQTGILDGNWHSVTYGNGLFVAVGYGGGESVMTSGNVKLETDTTVKGNLTVTGGIVFKTYTDAVSNPPTKAELIALFGSANAKPSGWTVYINDAGVGADMYQIMADGISTDYHILTFTPAV